MARVVSFQDKLEKQRSKKDAWKKDWKLIDQSSYELRQPIGVGSYGTILRNYSDICFSKIGKTFV